MREIDLRHLGVPKAICCFVDDEEGWLVDPGPESTFETLVEGLGEDFELETVLLTHIHLDHAGATGRLLERFPDARVVVHAVGAPHVIDPSKLEASSRRLYGEQFDELWGAVVPVPEGAVTVVEGGEELAPGFRVAYTPGHARHHVSYLHEQTQIAYCGDVAGVRIIDGPVVPPTPPPEIDIEAWVTSVELLRDWNPTAVAVTHFGAFSDVSLHLEQLLEGLESWPQIARETDAEEYAARIDAFVDERTSGDISKAAYRRANPSWTLHGGLERYWSKRSPGA